MTRLSKRLKRFIKPFPRYGKAINAVVLLAFVMLVVAGVGAALNIYNKPTPITTSPTSSTDDNICVLGSSGCSDSQNSSTTTPTTKPAQTATPSTPATTTSPQSSTDSTTSDCTVKYLPPPPTTYEDTNLLPQGQTQQASQGGGGDEYICSGKPTRVYLGIAPVVWVGTGTSSSSSTSQGSTPTNSAPTSGSGLTEAQAAQQCDENLANGADSSDPQAYLDQCMHQYGY